MTKKRKKKFIFDEVAYSDLDNDTVADVELTAREVRDLEYFLEMVEIKREVLDLNAEQPPDVQENIKNDFKNGYDQVQRLIDSAKAQLED